MIGTSNVVSNISENILAITEKRSSLENLIIHCGAMDDMGKKKSEVLKEDFTRLLNFVGGLNIKVFLNGSFAPIFCGDEIFLRLLMINKSLKKMCYHTCELHR
ncbi:hypothetical protein AMECASPLE_025896 [Ameca splendens]|uniref:Uncharacterized protein n=1 Tax=Ameca splendens TaxID=208324 RepID=A0ABV0YSI6_9TELE